MTEEIMSNSNNNNQIKGMIDIMMIEIGITETIEIVNGIIIIRTTTITTEIIIATTVNQTEIIAEVDKIEIRIVIIKRIEITGPNRAIITRPPKICLAQLSI